MKTYFTFNGVPSNLNTLNGKQYLGIPAKDSFDKFATDLRELMNNDAVPGVLIENDLDFKIPEVMLPARYNKALPFEELRSHKRAMNRVQICRWIWEDDDALKSHKPVYLKGFNTEWELRAISGLPGDQFVGVYIDFVGDDVPTTDELGSLYSAADDWFALEKLKGVIDG